LKALKDCPEFIIDLLDLVRKDMLVVEAKKRAQISQVCSELVRIMPLPPKTSHNIEDLFIVLKVNQEDREHVPKKEKVSLCIQCFEETTDIAGFLGNRISRNWEGRGIDPASRKRRFEKGNR
jgi:hypothetical protein